MGTSQLPPAPREDDRPSLNDLPKFTIGMPTYDDYDGVYFSLQALRLFHRDVCATAEFIVVDNNPTGACAIPLQELCAQVPGCRYVAEQARTGSAGAKQRIFEEARNNIVLCIDCHVLIVPGALLRLAHHFASNPQSLDLIQGPLLLDDLQSVQTHFDPKWSSGMYGVWGLDPRGMDPNAAPFDIPMQGMGLFACRKAAWPRFNPDFRGFGGEEFYIHEKFRQHGGRTLCLPFLRWTHRFARPTGVPYRNIWEDRLWNYLTGFRELGLSTGELEAHFAEHVGKEWTEMTLAAIAREKGWPERQPE